MKNNIYACLEIGCAEAKVMICNIRDERLYVLSHHVIEVEGIENGTVVNVNQVVKKLKVLKSSVEADLNQEVQQVLLAIPSVDINIEHIESTLELKSSQPINTANIKQLFRNVINQPIQREQVVVNIMPRAFRVDEQRAVHDPRGILGRCVSIEAQKAVAPGALVCSLVNVVELAGFRIADIILGSMAEVFYTLDAEHLVKGASHVNIGKSMTTITVVQAGKIISTVALSVGGQDVTQDISEAFSVSEEIAEMLKLNFGRINLDEGSQEIVYADEVEGNFVGITRQMLVEVVTARYEMIIKVVKQYLTENAYKFEGNHYVLTGGGSEVQGIEQLAESILVQDVTVFRPSMLGVRHAKWSKLVGMAILSHEISLLTEQKSNIIDFNQYANIKVTSHEEEIDDDQSQKVQTSKAGVQEKSFMDHKLENSKVLVRLFDRIFDEKAE